MYIYMQQKHFSSAKEPVFMTAIQVYQRNLHDHLLAHSGSSSIISSVSPCFGLFGAFFRIDSTLL